MAEKEYGKLSVEQFQQLVRALPELRAQMQELPRLIRSKSREDFSALFGHDFHWAEIYEMSLVEQLALMVVAMGDTELLVSIAASPDPHQALLDTLDDDAASPFGEGAVTDSGGKYLFMLVMALQRNILSIMIYHQSLAALVEDVRAGSDTADESFFKAVRVDRSILACPTFADRLARAELSDEKAFFLHLRSALKGLSRKHWESYRDLRYSLAILRELGFSELSDAALEDLLVHKLKLYPNVPSARKNLRKQYTEAKRVSTTLK